MKIAISFGVLGLCVLLVFQNCNKGPGAGNEPLKVGSMLTVNEKQDLKQKNLTSIAFFVQDVQTVEKGQNKFQMKYTRTLDVDLSNGAIEESSDLKSSVDTYCMPLAWRNELNTILKSSEVCQYNPEILPETVCAQVITQPYAELRADEISYDLGAASDSCGSNKIDLCDQQSVSLQDFMKRLNASFSQMQCE